MKYVFIDTEGAIDQHSGLKTFGIVITDENFNVTTEREVYIDVNKDGTKRHSGNVKYHIPFNKMYCILRDYLTAEDTIVIGYNVIADVNNINKACERNKMFALKFDFFDVQMLYMKLLSKPEAPKLCECVSELGITEHFQYHTSRADARATARVLQKLCEKYGLTIAQAIESYPEFSGHTEKYMASFNIEGVGHTYANSSLKMFKLRVDLPLLYFKKQIGAMRTDGYRDGEAIYYDVILNKLFKDRHPHKGVGKAKDDCLVFGDFKQLRQRGVDMLKRCQPKFYNAAAELITKKYVVSYECVGCIEDDVLTLLYGNKHLGLVSETNKYVKMLFNAHIDPEAMIRRYYTADTFEQTIRRNTKWNYGDRNREITLETTPFEQLQLQDGDELYLPRVYASVLTNEFGDNAIVACQKEHFQYAPNQQDDAPEQKMVDIDTLNLPDNAIKLVAKDADGNVYGFLPVVRKIKFPMFDCVYELPLLVRRKLSNDVLQ